MKSVVIVANGKAHRFGADKLANEILGKTLLAYAVDAFFGVADEIVIVSDNAEYVALFPFAKVVAGGETRTQSVRQGLSAVSENCDVVAIHDGARPFVTKETVAKLFAEAAEFGSAVPYLPTTDTTYNIDARKYVDRHSLARIQTPQVFAYGKILAAYEHVAGEFTDDSQVFSEVFGIIHLVKGQLTNSKVTYKEDLPTFTTGVGYDVHRLVTGDGVILGGVKIPSELKLLGHSDADVLTHAVMDALLSASNNRDIGCIFPDTDMQYKGADSVGLLGVVKNMLDDDGYNIASISAVVIAEKPKLAPYIDAIRANLAHALAIPFASVNVSATTTEGLGVVGEGNAIAAQATCILMK
jgi:2-C-methyl-D-erythritol 2,4-cyclodiphosphate synthase/2-C-methyl-D-erythritol 4-phosphate cytidylyltransferase